MISKLITEKEIKAKIRYIAHLFAMDNFDEKELNFLIVLKGAKKFADVFIDTLSKKFKIKKYYIQLSSYSGKSPGMIKVVKKIKQKLEGKHIFIIEDIVDTGATLKFLKDHLKKKKVKSIKVISLLNKTTKRKTKIDYICFDIPNLFVVGYGLDHDGKYRNLRYIGYLK